MSTSTEVQTALPQPELEEIHIEQVLQALGDPVRLRIVRALATAANGLACGVIPLPVTNSTRTHHMRFLRRAGVITVHAKGTRRISRLRRDDLDTLYPGLLDAVIAAPH